MLEEDELQLLDPIKFNFIKITLLNLISQARFGLENGHEIYKIQSASQCSIKKNVTILQVPFYNGPSLVPLALVLPKTLENFCNLAATKSDDKITRYRPNTYGVLSNAEKTGNLQALLKTFKQDSIKKFENEKFTNDWEYLETTIQGAT